MELWRFSDSHFIQAAKGGLLVKTLNVTCGRPVLKFKKLTDIKDEIEGFVFDSSGVQVESPDMISGEKGIIKSDPEASEFSCSVGGDNGRNSVMDDLDIGYMTLKQLKERFKEKKRKYSECVDLNRETDIKCSHVKQEYSNVKSDEDELDLMEPLSSWKSKLAKNKRAKSQCLKKRVFAPFRSASSVMKSEDIPSHQGFLQSKRDLSAPIDIKKEVLDIVDCSDYENNSSLICDNQLDSCGIVPKEVPEIAAECVLETRAEDPQICVVNEAYNKYMDNCSTESVHIVSATTGDIKKVYDPEIISHNLSVSESKGEEYVTQPICDNLFEEQISSTNDRSFGMHDGHQSVSINHEMQWLIDSDGIVQVPVMTTNNFDQFVEASGSDACSLEDDSRGDLPSNFETNALHSVSDFSLVANCCLVSTVDDSPVVEEKEAQRSDCDDAERNCFSEILHRDSSEEFTTTIDDGVGLKHLPERFFPIRTVNNIKKVDDAARITLEEVPEIAAECGLGTGTEDRRIYVVNEACCEYMDNCSTESVHIVSASYGDFEKVDDPEIISHNISVSESRGEEYVTHPICDDLFQEPISLTNDHSFGIHDGHQSFSINHEMQGQIDNDRIVQVPDMATNNFDQLMEASGSDASSHENDFRDGLPSNLDTIALYGSVGDCRLGSSLCLVSSAGDSPVAEEKESQRSDCDVNVEGNCFSEIPHHDAPEEFTTIVDVGCDDSSEPKRPPERLFPTRKAISPSFQEKLCKAMESVELHDEEHYVGKKKLCFAKETEDKTKILRAEGLDQVKRIRFSIKPKHIVIKTKDEKRDSRPNGIPKVPNLLPAVPRINAECASIQWCSQSAIAFSERQMQDIECLATKLRNELKTMKEIAEERLWSEEAYPATSLKYDASKVRMAIKNVKRAERSAQRWISMMARDCNRFCKIMRLTETSSVAPKSVNKVRKKVTFADEAGEKLCHVRIF